MGWVIALVIIVAVVALDVAMLHGAKPENPAVSPYTRSTSLFTSAETSNRSLFPPIASSATFMPIDESPGDEV